jgi:uncharacterized membrane protein YozB (DUF420 family)
MVSSLVAQSNLGFQIVILAVLFASLVLKKRGNFLLHGSIVMVATILNAFSFILVMGPSLLNLEQFVVNQPLNIISMVTMAHASFGTIVEILAVWVVVSWRLRSSTRHCVRKRKIMRVTLALWLIAVFLGVLLYAFLYVI